MHKARYLIIGNSAAAINAVEAIRKLDRQGDIAIISDEPYHTYSRPLITYYLMGKIKEDRLGYRPLSFYDTNKVMTFLGKEAVSLDTDQKKITLKDETGIRFEKLLLTTGGTPFVPDTPGKDLEGIFTFTTLDDANRVKGFIAENHVKKAVVVGGGLIGLKVTEALLALNIQVTIIELADRIMSAAFDQTASGIIEQALSEIGCLTITGNTVGEFLEGENKRIGAVILKDGTKLPCDLVIIAIGVRPRVNLAQGTAIKINKGILVDPYLMTSLSGIYAAGDVIEAYDLIHYAPRPVAILPNASRQGSIAGYNMAGVNRKYAGCFAMNSIELAGIPTICAGLSDPSLLIDEGRKKGMEVILEYKKAERVYKKIVLEGKKIVGTIFIGNIDRAGIYTGLIKDKIDISPFKDHMLKEDFGLICFPKEYRKHLVSGQAIEV